MRLASRRVKLFVLTVLSTSLVGLGLASQRARLEPVDLALLGPELQADRRSPLDRTAARPWGAPVTRNEPLIAGAGKTVRPWSG